MLADLKCTLSRKARFSMFCVRLVAQSTNRIFKIAAEYFKVIRLNSLLDWIGKGGEEYIPLKGEKGSQSPESRDAFSGTLRAERVCSNRDPNIAIFSNSRLYSISLM